MHRATSQLTDDITVRVGDYARVIQPGDEVDLDEPVGTGTLAEALGPLATSFAPAAGAPVHRSQARRSSRSEPAAESGE